jgi:hypothetical protein
MQRDDSAPERELPVHVPAVPISSFARRSVKIFDAILAAFTPLLVDIAPEEQIRL